MARSGCSANCHRKVVSLFSCAGSPLRWPHARGRFFFCGDKWVPAAFMHCWWEWKVVWPPGENGLEVPRKVKQNYPMTWRLHSWVLTQKN